MTDREQKPVFLASSEAQVAYALHIVDKNLQQAEQKPVAWMYTDAQGKEVIVKADVAHYEDAVPLYTVPQKPWGWAIVHSDGSVYRTRQKITNSWCPSIENEPFTADDLEKADEEYKGCAPHTMITLYT